MQLVTGGRGFIGSQLVRALHADGLEILVVDDERSPGPLTPVPGVHYLPADIADPATWARVAEYPIAVAYHLGAHANVAASSRDPEGDFQSNTVGMFQFLQWARGRDLKGAVFASSAAIYGDPGPTPIAETTAPAPRSPYGASKVAGEAYARVFHLCYGTPVVIARIFNTYGPGMRQFVLFDFVRKLQADPHHLEVIGTGQQVRDYSYITDTVAALRLLATTGAPGQAYNIASGQATRVLDLAQTVMDAMGLSADMTCTGQSWPGDVNYWHADISKLRALGFAPRVPLAQGVRRTVEWLTDPSAASE
ncbi:MAG: NAD-dependent epimerase/dehydratase family protein [Armatimonadetes bacterium]|nr:NAD-dependent epimerase/dehydratase family protein [Armatimonadota bacterium]